MEKELNYENVYNRLVTKTGRYIKENNLKSMILGISGGLDSTVVSAIAYEVSKKFDIEFIGVELPSSTNSFEETLSSAATTSAFCENNKKLNISTFYNTIADSCFSLNDGKSNLVSLGNIKARLRMIFLYDLAQTHKGIVLDTDNLTEHYLGFWTIHGDVGDFNPIGGLWKTEVYELAKWIRDNKYEVNSAQYIALDKAINITPTDGNGVKEGGDLAQIAPGYTYTDVDKVLKFIVYNPTFSPDELSQFVNDEFNGDNNTVSGIFKRYRNSEFKRKQLPIRIARNELI